MSKLLSAEAVAERLDITVPRVWWLVRTKRLPAVRIGRVIRISEQSLAAWCDSGGSPSQAVAAPMAGTKA